MIQLAKSPDGAERMQMSVDGSVSQGRITIGFLRPTGWILLSPNQAEWLLTELFVKGTDGAELPADPKMDTTIDVKACHIRRMILVQFAAPRKEVHLAPAEAIALSGTIRGKLEALRRGVQQ